MTILSSPLSLFLTFAHSSLLIRPSDFFLDIFLSACQFRRKKKIEKKMSLGDRKRMKWSGLFFSFFALRTVRYCFFSLPYEGVWSKLGGDGSDGELVKSYDVVQGWALCGSVLLFIDRRKGTGAVGVGVGSMLGKRKGGWPTRGYLHQRF